RTSSNTSSSSHRGHGALYVNSSEFINHVDKHQISSPVSAQPMGLMDITACDVICRGIPSQAELKLLRRHVRKTASLLGARVNNSIEQSIAV
ncbi:hypothetical protein GGI12_001665, partial [Dipsacomyces acuminosporus]